MSSPENYDPNLPENVNARNEAGEINEMVDKGLISRQEAGEFDYADEMEIPEALLSVAPKVSERMRQHIVEKLDRKIFGGYRWGENTDYVQGTWLHAIKQIWMATGETKTGWGGAIKPMNQEEGADKGYFNLIGDVSRLPGEDGFLYVNEDGRRQPGYTTGIPIFILLHPDDGGALEMRISRLENKEDVHGIVLARDELLRKQSDDSKLTNPEETKYYVAGKREIALTIRQEANYIAHCMVAGVDKSKIVPIYDWDGNLLWPTETDVISE